MKKTLSLLFLSAAFALNSNAQVAQSRQSVLENRDFNAVYTGSYVDLKSTKKAPRKAYSNNVYYTVPEGALYNGTSIDGKGYNATLLYLAPFSVHTFVNKSLDKASSDWYMLNTSSNQEVPLSSAVDDDYNLNWYIDYSDGSSYFMPRVRVGSTSYFKGETSANPKASYMLCDTIADHKFYSDYTVKTYYFSFTEPNGYIYGTGYLPGGGTREYMSRIIQFCPKPMSPLYIEHFVLGSLSSISEPIAEGKELTLQIRNVEYVDGERTLGGTIIAELKATKEDLVFIGDGTSQNTQTGKYFVNMLKFSQKEIDFVGNEVSVPFTVTDEFAIVIAGIDQDGVDIGFATSIIESEEEKNLESVVFVTTDESGNETGRALTAHNYLDISFYGGYDYCEVLASAKLQDGTEISNINVLEVSNDGTSVVNQGYPALENHVAMDAAFSWTDPVTAQNNYSVNFDDMPEWVYMEGLQGEGGRIELTIECEALPEGETGRFAVLYMEGHGYKSTEPIIILQGNATLEDALATGITTPVSTAKVANKGLYSLSGQRVNKNYKGVVISEGKKILKK